MVRVMYTDTPKTEVILVLENVKVPKTGEVTFTGYAIKKKWAPRVVTTSQVVANLGEPVVYRRA